MVYGEPVMAKTDRFTLAEHPNPTTQQDECYRCGRPFTQTLVYVVNLDTGEKREGFAPSKCKPCVRQEIRRMARDAGATRH